VSFATLDYWRFKKICTDHAHQAFVKIVGWSWPFLRNFWTFKYRLGHFKLRILSDFKDLKGELLMRILTDLGNLLFWVGIEEIFWMGFV
jgi:hypothetical protein